MFLPLLFAALPPPEDALAEIFADSKSHALAIEHLHRQVDAGATRLAKRTEQKAPEIAAGLREQIASNLIDKLAAKVPLDLESVRRTVIDYEIFKAEKFTSSGVFPKRYFGYFDLKHDTEAHERTMRRAIEGGVDEVNRHLERNKSPLRITEMEVAITFLAEGGALLLLAPGTHDLTQIHPVYGVGLDDIATGFERNPELIARIDHRLGIGLATIVDRSNPNEPRLSRLMTFEEAIAGTTVMWLYEKELAARKLANAEGTELDRLPLDEQFIFGSLVYNSGLIFSSARMKMIRDFETAAYLAQTSRENEKRRWPLPLFDRKKSISFLLTEHRYPGQPTSWSAVYHVLQRYGGYAAIKAHTNVFDGEGRFRAD